MEFFYEGFLREGDGWWCGGFRWWLARIRKGLDYGVE